MSSLTHISLGLYDEPANNVTSAMPQDTYESPPDVDGPNEYFDPEDQAESGYLDVEGEEFGGFNDEDVGEAAGFEEGPDDEFDE
jgi:hypothetical protein